MTTDIIRESIELVENTINHEQRTVDVVLIRPGWSANKRYYGRDVLAKAATLYESAFAFADHQSLADVRAGKSRSMLNLTGRYTNVHIGEAGELRATRLVYDNGAGNAVWPVIVDAVENPGSVRAGLSHTAVGKTGKGEADGIKGEIVEDITAVHSVDDVVSPAAGGEYVTLAADTNSLRGALMEALTYDEWQTARPEFVVTLKKENKRARQTEQERAASQKLEEAQTAIVALEAELATLREEKATAESEVAAARDLASRSVQRVALEQAFRKVNLPRNVENELRQEIETTTPDKWPALIERAAKLKRAVGGQRVQVSGASQRVHTPPVQEQRTTGQTFTAEDMANVDSPEDLAKLMGNIGG